jgi:hypothetical protein
VTFLVLFHELWLLFVSNLRSGHSWWNYLSRQPVGVWYDRAVQSTPIIPMLDLSFILTPVRVSYAWLDPHVRGYMYGRLLWLLINTLCLKMITLIVLAFHLFSFWITVKYVK